MTDGISDRQNGADARTHPNNGGKVASQGLGGNCLGHHFVPGDDVVRLVAYQSKLWGETQGSRDGDAATEMKNASENRLLANEIRAVEISLFLKILEAKNDGKEPFARFLISRLFPSTQAAFAAWWELEPMKNADTPRSPFLMPQYKQPQVEEAKQQEERAKTLHESAGVAGRNSDTYVLLTVLFASVLFFGGISGTFDQRRLRQVVLAIALVLFLVTLTALVTMPIAWT